MYSEEQVNMKSPVTLDWSRLSVE